jgi:hypothetical protein
VVARRGGEDMLVGECVDSWWEGDL